MKSSPITIRMIELRISSDPTVGPTVTMLRGWPSPKRAMSSFSRASNGGPGITGGGGAAGGGLGGGVGGGVVVGLGVGVGLGGGVGVTPDGSGVGVGAGVTGG